MQCPQCKTKSPKHLTKIVDSVKCTRCGAMFDPTPEPGDGDYSDINPAARLEREERRREKFDRRR